MGSGEKKKVLRLSNGMLVPHCMDGRKAGKENIVKGKQIGKERTENKNEWRGALLQNRSRLELNYLELQLYV